MKWKCENGKLKKKKVSPQVHCSGYRDLNVCSVSPHSLGVALSRGHGKYFFRGNVTIEEGKMLLAWHGEKALDELRNLLMQANFWRGRHLGLWLRSLAVFVTPLANLSRFPDEETLIQGSPLWRVNLFGFYFEPMSCCGNLAVGVGAIPKCYWAYR